MPLAPDGNTYSYVTSVPGDSTTAVAWDSFGIRGIWYKNEQIVYADATDQSHYNFWTPRFYFGKSNNTISYPFSTYTSSSFNTTTKVLSLSPYYSNIPTTTVVYKDFIDTGVSNKIQFVITINNTTPYVIDVATLYLLHTPYAVNANGGYDVFNLSVVNPSSYSFQISTNRWVVLYSDDINDISGPGLIGYDPNSQGVDNGISFQWGASSWSSSESYDCSAGIQPGASYTMTLNMEIFDHSPAPTESSDLLQMWQNWANRAANKYGTNYALKLQDRRPIMPNTFLADNPADLSTTNPSCWHCDSYSFDARPQQSGESYSDFAARMEIFRPIYLQRAYDALASAQSVNASAVLFWEFEGYNPVTSTNRYLGDSRFTYLLAPETSYRSVNAPMKNGQNMTLAQEFANILTSNGIEMGLIIRGGYADSYHGELEITTSSGTYTYDNIPDGTNISDILSMTRRAYNSIQDTGDTLLKIIRYGYDEFGATKFYWDSVITVDYAAYPGTSNMMPAVTVRYIMDQLAADSSRPGLFEKAFFFPETANPYWALGGGFNIDFYDHMPLSDFKDASVNVGYATGVFLPGWGRLLADIAGGDVYTGYVGSVLTTALQEGAIIGCTSQISPGAQEDAYLGGYASAYGSISGNNNGYFNGLYTLNLCSGLPSWCNGYVNGIHTINWGDGNTSTVIGPALTATHVYSSTGVYNITTTFQPSPSVNTVYATDSQSVLILPSNISNSLLPVSDFLQIDNDINICISSLSGVDSIYNNIIDIILQESNLQIKNDLTPILSLPIPIYSQNEIQNLVKLVNHHIIVRSGNADINFYFQQGGIKMSPLWASISTSFGYYVNPAYVS